MSYTDPEKVLSPKGRVRVTEVVFNAGAGPDGWSIVKLIWDGKERVGIRWNGEREGSGVGNPQSRGKATWFVVPGPLQEELVKKARDLANGTDKNLIAGYREMAEDREREQEAEEWCEGLMANASEKG